jgi:HPt (histidine-containing phosphotransfer) domain-containing protein
MSLTNAERLSTVVDYDELVTRCLNKIDFAERMLTLFQNHCGQELAHLEQACETGDLESIRRISHRLAGAAANAAAGGLQGCAAELRRAATSGSLDTVTKCLGELQREWRRFNDAMAAPSPESIETLSTGV